MYSTLMRDHNGLGFSIPGSKGAAQFKPGSDAIFISKITDGGAASRDGKLQIGDRFVSINGVDLEGARHDQVVTLLTGLDRFIRLVVHRPKTSKILSGPKPYSGLYSSSYMANRPTYTGYKRPQIPGYKTPSFESPSDEQPPSSAQNRPLTNEDFQG